MKYAIFWKATRHWESDHLVKCPVRNEVMLFDTSLLAESFARSEFGNKGYGIRFWVIEYKKGL